MEVVKMKRAKLWSALITAAFVISTGVGPGVVPAFASAPTYNINTLAGKVASVNGTAGLNIRFSAFVQQEAENSEAGNLTPTAPITATNVIVSPLDNTSVLAPDVTVNGDVFAAAQNETAIAVDPNNPMRVVGGANDYVTRTWTCMINGTPCSGLGDGYSGTYFSNDGGHTWCCTSATDGSNIGTLVPGIEHLVGGQYDAGGDPALAFDSQGNVYYSGLGFDRTAPPNTVTVSRGTFDGSGNLSWSAPTFINPTNSPSTLNDKEWIAADSHASSPFHDRVYVSWTRFIFNPQTGAYVQSPIDFVYSTDGGKTFSTPELISGNALYDQGSRPVVAPDGTVYVFWEGATRLATLDSIYVAKSTDGGATFSKPVAVSQLVDSIPLANTAFRVNSFPAAAVAPNGNVYVTWTTLVSNTGGGLCPRETNSGCHSAAMLSMSANGGANWSAPVLALPSYDAMTQTTQGYPVTNPDGSVLNAPAQARRVDQIFPAIAVGPTGNVFVSAYIADVVSPWQSCAKPADPATLVGRIDCLTLGKYVNNARLDYVVRDVTTNVAQVVSTHPINTRVQFGGGFFGDYTDLTVGSDNVFHAFWTDSNNRQSVNWWYGYQFSPEPQINQEDVVVYSNTF
jgi:hypothetical protein